MGKITRKIATIWNHIQKKHEKRPNFAAIMDSEESGLDSEKTQFGLKHRQTCLLSKYIHFCYVLAHIFESDS